MAGGSMVKMCVSPPLLEPDCKRFSTVHRMATSTGPIPRVVRHLLAHPHMMIITNGICRPAGGNFSVEMSGNRAFTTLSYNGSLTGVYPDGLDHPEGLGLDGNWSVVQPLVCRSWTDHLFIASDLLRLTCMQSTNLVRINYYALKRV